MKSYDNQNMVMKFWINGKGQEYHVCMYGLSHGWSFLVII